MLPMRQYLYTVQATRPGMLYQPTSEEGHIAGEHIAYLRSLTQAGVGIFGGALKLRDSRHMGLFVFQVESDEEARSIVEQDPAVKNRIMRACLFPFRIALWNEAAFILDDTQQHFLYHIQAVRPEQVQAPTQWEQEKTTEHFYYLKDQTEKGVFGIVGRTQNEDYSTFGWGIMRTTSEQEAWKIAENDPAVIQRVMRLDVLPFGVAMFTSLE